MPYKPIYFYKKPMTQNAYINSQRSRTFKVYGILAQTYEPTNIPTYDFTEGENIIRIYVIDKKGVIGEIRFTGKPTPAEGATITTNTEIVDLNNLKNSIIVRRKDDTGIGYYSLPDDAKYYPFSVSPDMVAFYGIYAQYGNNVMIKPTI